ncbi:hypothetical protein [Phytohabitans rumicis]|nr:hypothetical protein [Phytohabitans rumicis]
MHLFIRSSMAEDMVSVVVTRRSVNIGMLFAQARMVMRRLDASLAG